MNQMLTAFGKQALILHSRSGHNTSSPFLSSEDSPAEETLPPEQDSQELIRNSDLDNT